jgi:anti-sigma factor RsiW
MSPHADPIRLAASSGHERRAMLEHVRECAACRRALAAHDPTALFSLLALAPVPETLLDELSTEVARRTGSDRSAFGVIAGSAAWPRRAAAAAVLVLTLLSGYATLHQSPPEPQPVALSSQRADVDVESGRGVSQVIDLTVGETQIVMVYNGDLNL